MLFEITHMTQVKHDTGKPESSPEICTANVVLNATACNSLRQFLA